MKLIRKILFYLNVLLVFVTLLAYLSPFVNPGIFWGLAFLGLIVPILLFLNLLFIFYWLITQWKRSWLSIACLLLGAHYIALTISFSSPKKPEKYDFSIASYNMYYAYGTYKKGTYRYDKGVTAAFTSFLKKELNPDILCAQESNNYIKGLLNGHYSHQHVLNKAGTAIYSQFPFSQVGQIDFGTKTNSCVWADLVFEQDTFRVYSTHLQSNSITNETDKVLKEVEKDKKVDLTNIKTILRKYKKSLTIRSDQVKMIREHMDACPYPVILAGDFNDPPVSYAHRVLSTDRQDAFSRAGSGLGTTYAGNIPLLRIDNIILSDAFTVESYQTFYKNYSDHFPVKCKVTLN